MMVSQFDYRSSVGPAQKYDLIGAMQFNVLTHLGLREHHLLLDIGCGSLRAGRLFIPYLLPGRYFGIEPQRWLVEDGIEKELGRDAIRIKHATFAHNDDFRLSIFDREFDFMIAHSIFTHADADQIRTCLSEASRTLKGVMAATYWPDESNYEGSGWTGRATYRPDFIEALARDVGLTASALDWPHPNRHSWLTFKRSDSSP
jgi:hypothetical protein